MANDVIRSKDMAIDACVSVKNKASESIDILRQDAPLTQRLGQLMGYTDASAPPTDPNAAAAAPSDVDLSNLYITPPGAAASAPGAYPAIGGTPAAGTPGASGNYDFSNLLPSASATAPGAAPRVGMNGAGVAPAPKTPVSTTPLTDLGKR